MVTRALGPRRSNFPNFSFLPPLRSLFFRGPKPDGWKITTEKTATFEMTNRSKNAFPNSRMKNSVIEF